MLALALRIPALASPDLRGGEGIGGSRLRLALVVGAVAAGAILAVPTLPLVAPCSSGCTLGSSSLADHLDEPLPLCRDPA